MSLDLKEPSSALPRVLQNTVNEDSTACGVAQTPEDGPGLFMRAWQRIKYWLYLKIWCRHMYRHVMKFSHRFNWHYAPPSFTEPEYGKQNHWCQWCGLRGSTWRYDPSKPLEILPKASEADSVGRA